MARGAMVADLGLGYNSRPVRVDASAMRIAKALEAYLTKGQPTTVYAYYPWAETLEDIPTRMRNAYDGEE